MMLLLPVLLLLFGGLAIMGNGFCYRLAHLSMDELLVSPNAWEEPQKGRNLGVFILME